MALGNALLTCHSFAQPITPDEALRLAREYSLTLGHDPSDRGAVKYVEHPNAPGGAGQWEVVFGDARFRLEPSGLLARFRWMGAVEQDALAPGDSFAEDDQAWEFAEGVLAPLQVADGLYRASLQRLSEQPDQAAAVLLRFENRPFGYVAVVGNSATVTVRNSDRKILSLSIVRGWKYEEPNVQISANQAKQLAAQESKLSTENWNTILQYWAFGSDAPTSIRSLYARRTARLCYNVYFEGKDVTIDSVTGDVINFDKAAEKATPSAGSNLANEAVMSQIYQNPKYKPAPKIEEVPPPMPSADPKGDDSRTQEPGSPSLPLIGGVSAGVAAVIFMFMRSRRA